MHRGRPWMQGNPAANAWALDIGVLVFLSTWPPARPRDVHMRVGAARRAAVVDLVNQHRRTRLMIRSQVQALMIQSQVQETCTLVRFTRLVP
jgi:hypothetical protein